MREEDGYKSQAPDQEGKDPFIEDQGQDQARAKPKGKALAYSLWLLIEVLGGTGSTWARLGQP